MLFRSLPVVKLLKLVLLMTMNDLARCVGDGIIEVDMFLNWFKMARLATPLKTQNSPESAFEFFVPTCIYDWVAKRVAVAQPESDFKHYFGRPAGFATYCT